VRLTAADERNLGLATVESARAAAVTGAFTTARTVADRTDVAEADRALAGTTAAAAGAAQTEAAEAEVRADLVAHQRAERAHRVVTKRRVATIRRRRRVPGTHAGLQHADDAGVHGHLFGLVTGHVGIFIVFRTFDTKLIFGLLLVLLAH